VTSLIASGAQLEASGTAFNITGVSVGLTQLSTLPPDTQSLSSGSSDDSTTLIIIIACVALAIVIGIVVLVMHKLQNKTSSVKISPEKAQRPSLWFAVEEPTGAPLRAWGDNKARQSTHDARVPRGTVTSARFQATEVDHQVRKSSSPAPTEGQTYHARPRRTSWTGASLANNGEPEMPGELPPLRRHDQSGELPQLRGSVQFDQTFSIGREPSSVRPTLGELEEESTPDLAAPPTSARGTVADLSAPPKSARGTLAMVPQSNIASDRGMSHPRRQSAVLNDDRKQSMVSVDLSAMPDTNTLAPEDDPASSRRPTPIMQEGRANAMRQSIAASHAERHADEVLQQKLQDRLMAKETSDLSADQLD
jgi:hypothetical protein